MVAGCYSGNQYRIGGGFDFVVRKQTVTSAMSMGWYLQAYCSSLGTTVGTYQYSFGGANHPAVTAAVGGVLTVNDSSAYSYGTANISPCTFAQVTAQTSGSGSVSVGGTVYGGKYRKVGDTVTVSATANSGYTLKSLTNNGVSIVSGSATSASIYVSDDLNIVAVFVPSSYRVTCNTPSGGTVKFSKNGGTQSSTPPSSCAVNDIITVIATPNADKMVQNFVVDGMVTSGGSTGPQSFTFTIFERPDNPTYACAVTFADRASVADSVVGKSDGSTDDATVTTGGRTVTRTDGKFAAFVGNTYTATAHDPSNLRTFDGWVNANNELVSESKAYTWTQGSSAVSITAKYTDKGTYTENFYVGTSTSDYGSGSTAVVAGCTASISRNPNISSSGKWLSGSRTVTATNTPSGWSFTGVYVSSTAGGSKMYKANGASSVTFDNAADANIYALFANGASVSPSDVDQGHSSIATGSAATGLYKWEGGSANMAMRWHSKRFIASAPMAISTARVYADGYASGSDAIKLKTLTFQSPDATDSRVQETVAKSQDAYRLPLRRPEKYIELEVSAKAQVTQIAVSTSMEALWQA